jgi:hypothetical protein
MRPAGKVAPIESAANGAGTAFPTPAANGVGVLAHQGRCGGTL